MGCKMQEKKKGLFYFWLDSTKNVYVYMYLPQKIV